MGDKRKGLVYLAPTHRQAGDGDAPMVPAARYANAISPASPASPASPISHNQPRRPPAAGCA